MPHLIRIGQHKILNKILLHRKIPEHLPRPHRGKLGIAEPAAALPLWTVHKYIQCIQTERSSCRLIDPVQIPVIAGETTDAIIRIGVIQQLRLQETHHTRCPEDQPDVPGQLRLKCDQVIVSRRQHIPGHIAVRPQ